MGPRVVSRSGLPNATRVLQRCEGFSIFLVPFFLRGFRPFPPPFARRDVFHVWHLCSEEDLVIGPRTRTVFQVTNLFRT